MSDFIRKLVDNVRYTVEGFRVLFGRTDLSVDETMDEISALRRKYGLRMWDR